MISATLTDAPPPITLAGAGVIRPRLTRLHACSIEQI
jgi:hypothetical protein